MYTEKKEKKKKWNKIFLYSKEKIMFENALKLKIG